MRKVIFSFVLICLLAISGCIKNDIPYPIRKGVIKEIEFRGQKSVTIDEENRIVNLVLTDTTDIQNGALLKFTTTENTTVTPVVDLLPMEMDLRNNKVFLLKTYQDYSWTIKTTQPVDRVANVNGQVGKAVFDNINHTVIIYVSETTNRENLVVNELIFASQINSTVTPDPKTVKDYSLPVQFEVIQHNRPTIWSVVVAEADATLITMEPIEIWAKRAVLSGVMEVKDGVEFGFEYRKDGDADYTKITGSSIITNGGEISTTIVTEPNTKYTYHIYQGTDVADDVKFTSEQAPTIPNLSMDDWCLRKSGSELREMWYPCLDDELKVGVSPDKYISSFWDTGNEGVAMFKNGNVYPTTDAVSGKAAYLETVEVPIVGMAAGSLFIGDFKTNLSNPSLSPTFGRPFIGKPTRLTGKYKYFPKKINKSNGTDEMVDHIGEMDKCHIWIRLENRDGATPKEIAYGSFVQQAEVSNYSDFTIEIAYKDEYKNLKVTHMLLVISSSYYGDAYTGGIGTKLYLDNLDLAY